MTETMADERPSHMTPETARILNDLFRASHPSAAEEIGHFVDGIIHGLGDDVPDAHEEVRHAGGPVSIQTAQAAVEFLMAAMLTASR